MALFSVFLEADFVDAAERTTTKTYMLRELYDDTVVDDWPDTIQAQAAAAITALNVLTMDQIPTYRVVMHVDTGAAAAAINSNNQVAAFSRILDVQGDKGQIEVPAWDDTVFDENSQNVLSDAYDTAVAVLALQLRAVETGENFVLGPEYSQSRTRKSRNIIHD